jgi:phosphatidylserine/phosphatidylglycerophosphate/cardiolipin synthase-like enzyme
VLVMTPDPSTWLLTFSSTEPSAPNGDGRPWGDGTAMAARATAPGGPRNPWDENCQVSTYIGGYAAMSAIRDSLELAITEANAAGNVPGKCGRVYIADWRFNCLRDLSDANLWKLGPWDSYLTGNQAAADQTAIGLVRRLMQAGILVRVLLWYPTQTEKKAISLGAHLADHRWAAQLVAAENKRLMAQRAPADGQQIGVVALDMRVADAHFLPTAGAHHQKAVVIRGARTSVAYVGGVDLAYTRRDAPLGQGDWQSATGIPNPAQGWPKASPPGADYTSLAGAPPLTDIQGSDLPPEVYGDSSSAANRQIWHDQHLQLRGPIVTTLEAQFMERWGDTTDDQLFEIDGKYSSQDFRSGQVIFSTPAAIDATHSQPIPVLLPLPAAEPAVPGAVTRVQMWRTIPWRKTRTGPPFQRAEFTVMAGIANAVKRASELIWIFDQYFWSQPLARLLNARLQANPGLRLIVVLPPYADSTYTAEHYARALALNALINGLPATNGVLNQVAVYNLWLDPTAAAGTPANRGIYVHAKAHTYDGSLLVCGSANLNRRSFTCDSELACAVLDPAVVLAHQNKLWATLFKNTPPPGLDLNTSGNGAKFFSQFLAAATTGPATMIPDPWRDPKPTLPNNQRRDQSWVKYHEYDWASDPSSITSDVETTQVRSGPTGDLQDPTLDDIVARLERVYDGNTWPWRRP